MWRLTCEDTRPDFREDQEDHCDAVESVIGSINNWIRSSDNTRSYENPPGGCPSMIYWSVE